MPDEKRDSGVAAAAVLGVAGGLAVIAIAAAASAKPSPKPPTPTEGCTRTPQTGGFLVECFEKGPDSLMEFEMDQPFYIEDFELEVDLTGIGAVDGQQKLKVDVALLFLDDFGNVKKEFDFFDVSTPTLFNTSGPVGVIAKSLQVQAVTSGIIISRLGFGPSQLTLAENGELRMNVR